MKRGYYIGLDTYSPFTEFAVMTEAGKISQRGQCATTIPAISDVLRAVPRPRFVTFEEGPLAGWLYRNLREDVDRPIVCEPRRNRLIAEDGDKDDPVDAGKLADLLRGGYLKEVHQAETLERAVFKQHVSIYHGRVRHRVREALQLISLFRRHGVAIREKNFADTSARNVTASVSPTSTSRTSAICRAEVIVRFEALPGIGWVRAATLFAILDTPWRFGDKSALWKYLGIGLERRRSGNGREQLHVPKQVNRILKSTILGAAKSAAAQGDNPFADQYRRWLQDGLSIRLARRNVARSLSATLWGLWKNGTAYHPDWVGVAAAAMAAAPVSL